MELLYRQREERAKESKENWSIFQSLYHSSERPHIIKLPTPARVRDSNATNTKNTEYNVLPVT